MHKQPSQHFVRQAADTIVESELLLRCHLCKKVGLNECEFTGYGYFRPHIQMFDPAWREDDTLGSKGKQPMAIIKR